VLEWARANGCPWSYMTCSHAAEAGQLEVLQWARTMAAPLIETIVYSASAAIGEVQSLCRQSRRRKRIECRPPSNG
jgi:hypothetical protein